PAVTSVSSEASPVAYYSRDSFNTHVTPSKPEEDFQTPEEYVEESLSLDDWERQMIIKALEKNHGRRKNAARDLNISERTLYRKIKEYGLDKENE
ncbi:MAG TPA: sigma-54-dependent Fis family transcriptional regulator, partial [Candidatus Paraprevotella stercorigallinarum]|nr:sigma-54-dependent Fis family transcriptional regulator [Candidatus Paraprevotella stercorigallinarum]